MLDRYRRRSKVLRTGLIAVWAWIPVMVMAHAGHPAPGFTSHLRSTEVLEVEGDHLPVWGWLAALDSLGCIYPTACNFDASALADDGSCEFAVEDCETCEGGAVILTDADGDGICDSEEVAGCQDEWACNYDSTATDEAPCEYPMDLYGSPFVDCAGEGNPSIHLKADLYPTEADPIQIMFEGQIIFAGSGWDLFEGGAQDIEIVDLSTTGEGDYQIFIGDLWGDGGTLFQVMPGSLQCMGSCSGVVTGGGSVFNFTLTSNPVGCTDPEAENYDSAALVDDGSCIDVQCDESVLVDVLIQPQPGPSGYVSYFADLGWSIFSGQETEVSTGLFNPPYVLADWTVEYAAEFCLNDSSCFKVDVSGSNTLNAQVLVSSTGEVLFQDTGLNTSNWEEWDLSFGLGLNCGCTDEAAWNFDASADQDDGTCLTTLTCSDDVNEATYLLYLTHDTYDEWGGSVAWVIDSESGDTLVEAGYGTTPDWNLDGRSGYWSFCGPENVCAQLRAGSGFVGNADGAHWVLLTSDSIVLSEGGVGIHDVILGQSGAMCVAGCTEPAAANYSIAATVDDGSCVFCEEGENNVVVVLDAGASTLADTLFYEINSLTSGETVLSGFTAARPSLVELQGCIPPGCYSVDVSGNALWWDVWYVEDHLGYAHEGDYFIPGFPEFSETGDCWLFGCTEAGACNFDASAVMDDGSCLFSCFEPCTDPFYDVVVDVFPEPLLCAGDSNAVLHVFGFSTLGPEASLNFSLSPPMMSGDSISLIDSFPEGIVEGLTAGTYTVYAMDEAGCVGYQPGVEIMEPAPFILTNSGLRAECSGQYGLVELSTSGGAGEVMFSIGGYGFNTDSVFELPAGAYDFIAQDSNGCRDTLSGLEVPYSDAFDIQVISMQPASCDNAQNGELTLEVTGAFVPPVQFSVDGVSFAEDSVFTGLTPGFYGVIARDALGCQAINDDAFVSSVDAPECTWPTDCTDPFFCDDPDACNYGMAGCCAYAALPCEYCGENGAVNVSEISCESLEVDVIMDTILYEGLGEIPPGFRRYRLYAVIPEGYAMMAMAADEAASPPIPEFGYNAPCGCYNESSAQAPEGYNLGSDITLTALSANPTLEYDSWWTIGMDHGAMGPEILGILPPGYDICSDTIHSGVVSFISPNDAIIPEEDSNRVLIGQITTCEDFSFSVCVGLVSGGEFPITWLCTDGAVMVDDLCAPLEDVVVTPTLCGVDIDTDGVPPSIRYRLYEGFGEDYVLETYQPDTLIFGNAGEYTLALYDTATTVAWSSNTCQREIEFQVDVSGPVPGCTLPLALNYAPEATMDDNSCLIPGCMDPTAINFQPLANEPDVCLFSAPGCFWIPELSMWNCDTACSTDVNNDGSVSIQDLLVLLSEFGTTCF